MTISTTDTRPPRSAAPATVVACRILIGVQGAMAVAATALAGFAVIYFVAVALGADGGQGSLARPVLLIGGAIVLSCVLLASLARFGRGEAHVRRTIIGCELALAGVLVAFLVTSAGRDPVVWSVPLLDLICCVLVAGLLTTPTARRWTAAPS